MKRFLVVHNGFFEIHG
jgi:hypothetical protein